MDPAHKLVEQAPLLLGLLLLALIVLVVGTMAIIYFRHRRERRHKQQLGQPAYTLEELQRLLAEEHINGGEYERLKQHIYARPGTPERE